MSFNASRRTVIAAAGSMGVAALGLAGCDKKDDEEGGEVTANEDLMREHGIIRRALFIYGEAARRARTIPSSIPLGDLANTATLFRQFAEDYHERALEEQHIFPEVRKVKAPVAQLPDVLLRQHQRGREITDYILHVATSGHVLPAEAERFASTLESLVAMYGPHAAYEDTVLFPAWKAALGSRRYEETGDQFEELEKKMFGHDGFQDAADRIAKVEQAFGIGDLSALTAPEPPRA